MEKVMKVKLRNLKLEDADGMLEWMHDPNSNLCFRRNMQGMTKKDVISFIKANECFTQGNTNRHYAVVDETDMYLGTISLKDIRLTDLTAEYAISLRGRARGNGVASAATKLILKVAFEELGLERVYLNVLASNERAIRFYEKVGFVEERSLRKNVDINGKLRDLKWYSILKENFEA